jgi:type I restriction enzyme R subunit
VTEAIMTGHRKALLVMATGTGKTRTAASLTDVLSRGGYITNTLFLADRTAMVIQAKDAFKNYLPDMSLCNLLSNKDDKSARIVFSTYPTMLNAIDTAKSEGQRLFTPAHFDLIIVDEAHRSIFKKYRVIFEYFDCLLVGLTATPKTDVDRNTYDFFEMENGVPTYAYDYETAVEQDHVLVPYYNIEVTTKFLEQGITYDELSEEDKARYEEDFTDEDGAMPEFIPSPALNEFIFNQATVDMVLEDLMTKGIKVAGGDRLGKTIIFAQNKKHAEYIIERFDKLYPQYRGRFAKRVICDDSYAQTIIDDFKIAEKDPHIAVSVDMLDTGIDVPEIVNLVFFKRVRSKTKFWQMIGRGTRLCPNLFGAGQDKTHFIIFDYLGNFEFFREHKEGLLGSETLSLTEAIFAKRVRLIHHLQQSAFINEPYQVIQPIVTQGGENGQPLSMSRTR